MIDQKKKEAYAAPELTEAGSFEGLTQSTFSGTRGDFRAGQNVPQPILS